MCVLFICATGFTFQCVCLLVLPSTFLCVWHCLQPGAVLHAQKPPLFSFHLFTSLMLIRSFCRNASVQGQTQGREKGFSLVILSFPWTPLCRFRFFLIPPSLHPVRKCACESQDSGKQELKGGTLALTHWRNSTNTLSHCWTTFFIVFTGTN